MGQPRTPPDKVRPALLRCFMEFRKTIIAYGNFGIGRQGEIVANIRGLQRDQAVPQARQVYLDGFHISCTRSVVHCYRNAL
jgi:hypothetical protein